MYLSFRASTIIRTISLYLLIIAVSPKNTCDSNVIGKKFIIVFTENYFLHESNIELHVILVSFNAGKTEVYISSKFSNNSLFVTLQPWGFERVRIPNQLELIGNERSYKTIIIDSDNRISVQAIHLEPHTSDAYLAIPVENLGTQYVISTYQNPSFVYSTLFALFGTVDGTVVTIQLTAKVTIDEVTYSQGDTLTLNLNKFEAIQVVSAAVNFFRSNDLTGSIVNSNYPIGVISGHQCAFIPGSSCDALMEQSIPVNSWGVKHIYSNPPNEQDYSRFRLVAYFNNTIVSINGTHIMLESGGVWEDDLNGNGIITTSEPSLLIQILIRVNGDIVDPSLIQVPSEKQFTNSFGFTTPTHSAENSDGFLNFVNIIVEADERNSIQLNGMPIIANASLPSLLIESTIDDTGYVLLIVELPRKDDLYRITSNSPMSAIVYGYETDESYGYSAGISLPSSERVFSVTPFYIRHLGGELLTIELPCNSIEYDKSSPVKCKFGFSDITVDGKIMNSQVMCVTPPIFYFGYLTIFVSVDEGISFPFSGHIYVADEDTLQPHINITNQKGIELQFNSNYYMTTLNWDPQIFGDLKSKLCLKLFLIENSIHPKWNMNVILMKNIDNSGTFSAKLIMQNINTTGKTVGTLILSSSEQDGDSYITGPLSILNFTDHIPSETCSNHFHDILMIAPSGIDPCPCTSDQAQSDNSYEIDTTIRTRLYHPGSKICFRSAVPASTGSSQQCCYNENGNISLGTKSVGFANTNDPTLSLVLHYVYDVLPWIICCILSDNCIMYKKYRPLSDCIDYNPPNIGFTNGDPHFHSLDGHQYTFNGVGEFTIVSSSLLNFTFQARMEKFQNTLASVYTAFVIQTHNSSKIQLQRNVLNQTFIYIDDRSFKLTERAPLKRIANGVTLRIAKDFSQLNIQFSNGVGLIIYLYSLSMSFLLQLDDSYKYSVHGLLGNFNSLVEDDLMLPNGEFIPINSTLSQIHYQFGLHWLVNKSESLFSYQTPFDYNTYSQPSFQPTFLSPDINQVSSEVRELCGTSFPCLFDAVNTGVFSFARETLNFTTIAEEIMNKSVKIISCGFPRNITNAVLNASEYFPGNTIAVGCNKGYKLFGPRIIYCNATGVWSGNFTCSLQSVYHSYISLFVISLILILFLIFCIFVIIVLLALKYLKFNKLSSKEVYNVAPLRDWISL